MPDTHYLTRAREIFRLARLPAAAVTTSGLPFWRRLREGAEVFSRTKTLWFLMSANVAVAAGTALVMVNTVVYVRGVMDRDDAALGLTLACYGLGSLLVALATPWIVERVGVIRTMMAGVAVIAIALGPIRQTEVRHPGWLVERLGREQKENPA